MVPICIDIRSGIAGENLSELHLAETRVFGGPRDAASLRQRYPLDCLEVGREVDGRSGGDSASDAEAINRS